MQAMLFIYSLQYELKGKPYTKYYHAGIVLVLYPPRAVQEAAEERLSDHWDWKGT